LLKLGKEKRALKVAKHRVSPHLWPEVTFLIRLRLCFTFFSPIADLHLQLGGHSRGKAKRDQMSAVLQKQKMTKH
jgi:hypothetical protein